MPEVRYFHLDKPKFQELTIHAATLMSDDRTASIIRINKVLFYADFASYRQHGEPITGACYRKYSEGPAPDYMKDCIQTLEDTGRAHIWIKHHVIGDFKQLKPSPNFPADLSAFTPEQLDLVEESAEYLRGKTPREVIDITDKEIAWKYTTLFDHIVYEDAMASQPIEDQFSDLEAIKFALEIPVMERTW